MTAAMESHPLPWTEEEYLALGDTPQRIELFDGSLFVSPAPSFRHQEISGRLFAKLLPGIDAADLYVREAINVRLKTGRIPIPDLVIARQLDPDGSVLNAHNILLVCEIMSPSDAVADRVTKMHYYAVAGVPWYLLIDPEGPTMVLYRLDGPVYIEHAGAAPGRPMRLPDPINTEIDPADLVRD